jgi:hypothetical protein
VPGYEASTWYGVGAPKATPAEIVEKLNKEINAGLADPNMKTRLADLGGTVLAGSPADFGKLIAEETEKWGKVVSFTGIRCSTRALPVLTRCGHKAGRNPASPRTMMSTAGQLRRMRAMT